MATRNDIYKQVKALSVRLGQPMPLVRYPKGSTQYWREQLNNLNEIETARLRRAHRARMRNTLFLLRLTPEEHALRNEVIRVARYRTIAETVRVVAPNVVAFIVGGPNQRWSSADELREILIPYMGAMADGTSINYHFTLNGNRTTRAIVINRLSGSSIWHTLREVLKKYAEGNEYSNGRHVKVQMIGQVMVNPVLVGQRATLTDTNCAIQVVSKYVRTNGKDAKTIQKKINEINEKYLESGIDNEGLQALANAAQMRLVVSDRLGMTWQKFDVLKKNGEPIKGNVRKTVYMTAHNNHINEDGSTNDMPNWQTNPNAIEENSKLEEVKSIDALHCDFRDDLDIKGKEVVWHGEDEVSKLMEIARMPENRDANILKSKGEPIAVITATQVHKLKFSEYEKYPEAFTAGGVGKIKFLAQHKQFTKAPTDDNFLRIAKEADISGFYMRTAESRKNNFKFDMTHAYKSFRDSGLFRGFPNLSTVFKVDKKFSDFSKELSDLSKGLLYIEYPTLTLDYLKNRGMIHFEGSGWYPVEIVQEVAKRSPIDPVVKFYAYASDSFDVDFSDFTNDQFRTFIGKCNQNPHSLHWTTIDPVEFARARFILGTYIENIEITQNDNICGGNQTLTFKIWFRSNKSPWTCPIIAAYVKAHQKYNLFKMYNEIVYETDEVPIYVAVDSIELTEDWENLFDETKWKSEKIKVARCSPRVIERDVLDMGYLANAIEWEPPKDKASRLQFISGSGGTGKTEYILKISKRSDESILYVAPTHDACQVLIERGITLGLDITKNTMTYHKAFGFGCKAANTTRYKKIILDECSMISAEDLSKIMGMMMDHQELILSGDFGQLQPVNGTPIYDAVTGEYHAIFKDFEITELTKNWRQESDPDFFSLCQALRKKMTYVEAKQLVHDMNTLFYKPNGHISNEQEDIYMCGINTQVDEINSGYKLEAGSKVIMTKTVKDDAKKTTPNGRLGIVRSLAPISIEFDGNVSKFARQSSIHNICKLGYAITVHKAQGKTISRYVNIDPSRMFTQNHLYVALTRATRGDYIRFTKPLTMSSMKKTCRVESPMAGSLEELEERAKYWHLEERFDPVKLRKIIKHHKELNKHMRAGHKINVADLKQLLAKSKDGKLNVMYKQKFGTGRYFALGKSLQSTLREVRHTIAAEFYNDIDIKNAGPTLLAHICSKRKIRCPALQDYVNNRDERLSQISKCRDIGKGVINSIVYGGSEALSKLRNPPSFLRRLKSEIEDIHYRLSEEPDYMEFSRIYRMKEDEEKYQYGIASLAQRKILKAPQPKTSSSMWASFASSLMSDMESNILMMVWQLLGSPKEFSPAFDGGMTPKEIKFDLRSMEISIREIFGVDLTLIVKPMNEGFDLSNYDEDSSEEEQKEPDDVDITDGIHVTESSDERCWDSDLDDDEILTIPPINY